jgi:branched-chain amino acid transport system ATP-binding protein
VYALRIEAVSKGFGGLQVMQDLSLKLRTGERLGIIGPNGAGKTTLFNLIAGQLHPDSGTIFMFEKEVTAKLPHERVKTGLGRTFQITNLLLNLTVLENVALALQALQPSRWGMFRAFSSYRHLFDDARKLMDDWGLSDKGDMPVTDLSYGEQRCLEVVLGLASKPRLLLLDEPTCGMTPTEVAGISSMVQNLGREIAIILIAHDMDLIFGQGLDRIAVLHYGQIIVEGTPDEIKGNAKVREIYLISGDEK